MKNFISTIVFGFIFILLFSIFYHEISTQTLIKSFELFVLLNFSSLFSFLNCFHVKSLSSIIAATSWLMLILFATYIYKYASNKYSLSL